MYGVLIVTAKSFAVRIDLNVYACCEIQVLTSDFQKNLVSCISCLLPEINQISVNEINST